MSEEMEMTPERAAEMVEAGAQLIDVRETYEHEAGRIGGDRHIEMDRLNAEAGSIDRDRPVVFYCRVGNRSGVAAEAFRGAGWDAYNLAGGIVAWVEDGRPIEPENGEIAPH